MAVKDNWANIDKFQGRPGCTRRVFSGKRSMMVLNEIMPSAEPNLHSHPHEQLTYIIEGSAEFILGEEVLKLVEGDVILVPPNIPHSLKVTSNSPVLNLDVFTPIRDDYITSDIKKFR